MHALRPSARWQKPFALLLGLLFLTSCVKPPPAGPALDRQATLIMARPGDSVKLDPADISDSESFIVVENIFDTLVQFGDDGSTLNPALATSWEVSDDRKVWTLHLRKGVTFHDGEPFNAEAVKFNYERQMFKDHEYHQYGSFEYWAYIWGGYPGNLEKVEVVDEHIVRCTLKRPSAVFLANLAQATMAIASPAAIKQWKGEFFRHPVGTGPFKFRLWQPRERIVLDAFKEHFRGAPRLQQVVFIPVADATSRRLQLERGAVDLIKGLELSDLPLYENNHDLEIQRQAGMNLAYLAIHCEKPPYTDKRVRQALNHAIDKKTLVDVLYQGCGVVAVNPMPPVIWGWHDGIQGYPYDPQKARQLLAEAGFPNGFDTELMIMPLDRDYLPDHINVAEALQQDLAEVGIRARLVRYDWGTFLDKTAQGEHQLAILGWVGDFPDPDNFLSILLNPVNAVKGGSNNSFYKEPQVEKLLNDAQALVTQEERIPLYRKAQEIIHEDAPMVPLAHGEQITVFRKGLKGFHLHPSGSYRFLKAWWATP